MINHSRPVMLIKAKKFRLFKSLRTAAEYLVMIGESQARINSVVKYLNRSLHHQRRAYGYRIKFFGK